MAEVSDVSRWHTKAALSHQISEVHRTKPELSPNKVSNNTNMVNLEFLISTSAIACFFHSVNAHPGEKHSAAHVKWELERYLSAHAQVARAFSKFHEFPHAAATKERAIARRFATWSALREKRGIVSS